MESNGIYVVIGIQTMIAIVIMLVAFIGKGIHNRIDSLKVDLEKYRTKEACDLISHRLKLDIDNVADIARGNAKS